MTHDTNTLGARGEDLAVAHLISAGITPLARNWRHSRVGELDIIARDGEVTAFIEVKTRRGLDYGHPFEAITIAKQKRIRTLAAIWLTEQGGPYTRIRFDAIAVLLLADHKPIIEYRKGVF